MRKQIIHKTYRKLKYFFLLLLVIISIFVYLNLKTSLFFTVKERVNVVVYGQQALYYSLGLKDNLHYVIPYYSDLQIQVPGGYGFYRVGALGKLITLEKKPDLYKKAFSAASTSFTDYYFFPKTTQVFYGKAEDQKQSVPNPIVFLFHHTNANWFDRIYLTLFFLGKRTNDFINLSNIQTTVREGDKALSADEFAKQYQGYFYHRSIRDEGFNIQVQYLHDYTTGVMLGRVLEGNGIRVADISEQSIDINKRCIIKENKETVSQTALVLKNFFGCSLVKEKTGIYDILFIIGSLEKEWEVD